MGKKVIICALVLLFVFVLLFVCFIYKPDNLKFKEEYESLNNVKNYMDVSIPKNNNVKYASFDELMDFLDNGTGIVYFGFPECPWCRNAIPVLLKAAKENEISNVYYFNAKSIRDEKELKDGKIVIKTKGTDEYYKIVDKLSDFLGPYEGLEDDSIKRLYFPTVVFVMGGKIVGVHIGTVDSQVNPSEHLTDTQEQELFDIYNDYIDKIYGVCDDKTSC